jgi:hypothetical protein
MPLTLNVGISRKLGQADFGSFGAHCNLSVELDPAVLQGDADALQRHVRHAYAACSRAVNEELARQIGGEVPAPTANGNGAAAGSVQTAAAHTAGGNGHASARTATAATAAMATTAPARSRSATSTNWPAASAACDCLPCCRKRFGHRRLLFGFLMIFCARKTASPTSTMLQGTASGRIRSGRTWRFPMTIHINTNPMTQPTRRVSI